jgi:flavin reductase (NADH)
MLEVMASRPPVVPAHDFRSLMAQFPTGVAVITAQDQDGTPWGMTCSSICSVTISPPTLLACLRIGSPTADAVLESGRFAVNLLHDGAQPLAELFASGRSDRFDLVTWMMPDGAAGPHLAEHAHAIADCRVSQAQEVGEHTVVFGEIYNVVHGHEERVPLLYGRRRFLVWNEPQAATAC